MKSFKEITGGHEIIAMTQVQGGEVLVATRFEMWLVQILPSGAQNVKGPLKFDEIQ